MLCKQINICRICLETLLWFSVSMHCFTNVFHDRNGEPAKFVWMFLIRPNDCDIFSMPFCFACFKLRTLSLIACKHFYWAWAMNHTEPPLWSNSRSQPNCPSFEVTESDGMHLIHWNLNRVMYSIRF